MGILDISNLQSKKKSRFIRSLKRKIFNAPISQIIQLSDQNKQFLLVLCRIKNALGHFLGQFQDWCDKRKIYSHISPIFDLTQMDNPEFPISKFISINRTCNVFQKFVTKISPNSLFNIVNLPLYLPKGYKNVDEAMDP